MIIIIVEQLFNFIIDHSLADNTIARQTLSFGLPITSTIPFSYFKRIKTISKNIKI